MISVCLAVCMFEWLTVGPYLICHKYQEIVKRFFKDIVLNVECSLLKMNCAAFIVILEWNTKEFRYTIVY